MKKIILNIIGLLISVLVIISTFVFYKGASNVIIYASKDSYAYNYAKKNLIKKYAISDLEKEYFNYDVENFEYNLKDNSIEIAKYDGISSELVIPKSIKGITITSIAKDSLSDSVKTIVISNSINNIDEDILKKVEVKCYDTKYCKSLKENEAYKVTILNDSVIYEFDNSDVDFTYDIDEYVTITRYIGEDDTIIIPNHINGYEVKKLDFDGVKLRAMYIPDTVTNISGKITSEMVNNLYITSIIITIISFVIYSLIVSINKDSNLKDTVNNYPLYFVSVLYLLVNAGIVYLIRLNQTLQIQNVIYAIIVTILYIVIALIIKTFIKGNKKYDQKIKTVDSFIKEALGLVQDSNYDLKDIYEQLKYSDVVSIEEVKEIEENIKTLIKNINQDNLEDSKIEISKLISKRNRIIKDNK